MSDHHHLYDELEQHAPSLSKLERRDGFQVPDGYFDRLGDDVMRQIKSTEQEQVQQEPTRAQNEPPRWMQELVGMFQSLWQPRPALALALATLALLVIGVLQFFPGEIEGNNALAFEELTDEEYISYIAENIHDFEDDLLYEAIRELPYLPEDIDDEELNDYFDNINNDFDFADIEELL